MDVLKSLGYAAVGVCAVVAAPVFGAVGTVTAVGAVVGAAVGAGVGAVLDGDDDSAEIRAAEARGRNAERAAREREMAALRAQYEEATASFQKVGEYYSLVEALFTVGVACAKASGRNSQAEIDTLKEFIVGLSYRALPARLTDKMNSLQAKPPTLKNAYLRALKIAPGALDLMDQVAELAAHGVEGEACLAQWSQLRAA